MIDAENPGQDEDLVLVDHYRGARGTSANTYGGLEVHATAGLHDEIGRLATQLFPPGGRVVDLASGTGALCLRLLDLGFDVTGCDIVPENFALHDRIPFREANLNRAFADVIGDGFDAVTAIETLEHLENPRHFLRQCRKLLAPGGMLLLSTPNIGCAHSLERLLRKGTFAMFTEEDYVVSGHITPVGHWQLGKMLEEAGFEDAAFSGFAPKRRFRFSARRFRAILLRLMARRARVRGDTLIAAARAR